MNYSQITWLCWEAFGLVWLVGSIYNVFRGPRVVRKPLQSWRYWLIGVLLIYLVFHYLSPHSVGVLYRLPIQWVEILGVIILVSSTLFAIWARIVLGVMWSSSVTLKSDHELRTNGPYRITRHPIYTGILGMLVGSNFTVGMVFLPSSLVALCILLVKIRNEERLMEETFGEEYLDYKKRVPQLIPVRKW
ncbi:putative Isoprenylcysteine carboxyl methyltransferase [Candidatus Desulfosporosinus infrequens]|uniref:Putative Isoprenylcysteine carboxyl methyltransferase n=1 Tax=Candidatus Desulfosporosinus infrequens TaxID=2043169 RepID=A0A2U3LS42_9FIRM|nr:putative Isoprenylcysteine carboxyl methyltransferase [Candidatus Desulfosporosinus infrequens]